METGAGARRDSASNALCVTGLGMAACPLQILHAHRRIRSCVNKESQMKNIVISWELLRRQAQKFGPYLLIEAVMPGGSVLALLLYLYRTRRGL